MVDDDLDKKVKEIVEAQKERDEEARKKAEKEFRETMRKDTAGTVLSMFQGTQAQIANLQAQIDATNPLAPVMRAINAMAAKMGEIDQRLAVLEKQQTGVPR